MENGRHGAPGLPAVKLVQEVRKRDQELVQTLRPRKAGLIVKLTGIKRGYAIKTHRAQVLSVPI